MIDRESLLETDLDAIKALIANGQTEEAKREINIISSVVSAGSRFSKQIGELYFELGYPAMAGRYWYLIEDKTDRMTDACKEFERSIGDNPIRILELFGYIKDGSPHAKAIRKDLLKNAQELRKEHPEYFQSPKKTLSDRIALIGCAIVSFFLLSIFLAGIESIIKWFK